MMTAAARLGVCSSSSLSLFMRRSCSLAAAEADVWKKNGMASESEKSLYVCFYENSRCGGAQSRYRDAPFLSQVNQVVRRISLSGDDDDGGKEEWLQEAPPFKRCGDSNEWRFCGRFGSQILFPTGHNFAYTHVNGVDTSTQPMKFQKFKCFSSFKKDPVLFELNGKLYCIDHCHIYRPFEPTRTAFEVLDPEKNFKWRTMHSRPPLDGPFPIYASALEGSNKILSWLQGIEGVYCFDVAKPENGWTAPCSDLSNALPSLCYRRPPVFILNHHPDVGDFYLMFMYDSEFSIQPIFMSHNCDTFQGIENRSIQLPEQICSNYIPFMNGCDLEPPICTDFDIVHLGGQKFCLLLNKFYSDHPDEGRNTGTILLMTFEYNIIPNIDKPYKVDVQTRLLGTRHFRYHSTRLRKQTSCVHVTGAFAF